MNEAKLYADNFGAAFFEENGFLHFLKERTDGGWWRREESRDLHFLALDDESEESGDYINECMDNGTEDIMKDTMENTRLLLQAQDQCYPVRTCAIKSIVTPVNMNYVRIKHMTVKIGKRIKELRKKYDVTQDRCSRSDFTGGVEMGKRDRIPGYRVYHTHCQLFQCDHRRAVRPRQCGKGA